MTQDIFMQVTMKSSNLQSRERVCVSEREGRREIGVCTQGNVPLIGLLTVQNFHFEPMK